MKRRGGGGRQHPKTAAPEQVGEEEEDARFEEEVPLYCRAVAAPIGLDGTFSSSADGDADHLRVHAEDGEAEDEDAPSDEREEDELKKVYCLYGDSYTKSNPPPWLPSASTTLTLDEEVRAFAQFISPTPEERRMRREVIARLKKLILGIWPRAQVFVFGSSASELYLPLSDIDMGIVGAMGNNPLQILASVLRKQGVSRYYNVETIPKARVPIVKLVDAESHCSVDISFATTNNGTINTAITKRFIDEVKEIRPLALLLKTYLRQLGLSEPYTGGIGSYTLILMIISYLQLHRPEGAEGNDLGELLKGFLLLYGKHFNYHRTGISVRNGGFYFQKRERGWLREDRPWLLSIEAASDQDAGDITNDVSQSSSGIMEVREAFRRALHALTSTSPYFDRFPSLLSRILLYDSRLLRHRSTLQQQYRLSERATPSHSSSTRHHESSGDRQGSDNHKRSRSERDFGPRGSSSRSDDRRYDQKNSRRRYG